MAATKTQGALPVAEQTWLEPRNVRTVKVVSKGTVLLYYEPAHTVDRQWHLTPANGIMEIRPIAPFNIFIADLANVTVHVLEHIVLCLSINSMVNSTDL